MKSRPPLPPTPTGPRASVRPSPEPTTSRSRNSQPRNAQSPESGTNPDDRRALGAEGEERAANFLARRGYRIVDRNIRAGGVEVDLIAQRGRLIVFAEVKTRRTQRFGAPELAVDGAKQARLVRAAQAWLGEHGGRFTQARFDVISCHAPSQSDGTWRIDHLEGAFEAGG